MAMIYNARWYDPSLGCFAQADTIVPGGVQGLDRYAYVNNSPVNYSDPTGHLCVDENTWGYCGDKLPSPSNVKKEDRARYLRDVARKFDLKLAPGDYWEYIDYADVGDGETAGWTPHIENQEYDDRNGDPHFSSDTSVYITDKGFTSCQSDFCLAGIMAHEATHSWIELKIEQTSSTGYPRMGEYIYPEEVLADLVAITNLGDPQGILTSHSIQNTKYCEGVFGEGNCNNPAQMLEDYFDIDLSDINNDVFGR